MGDSRQALSRDAAPSNGRRIYKCETVSKS